MGRAQKVLVVHCRALFGGCLEESPCVVKLEVELTTLSSHHFYSLNYSDLNCGCYVFKMNEVISNLKENS